MGRLDCRYEQGGILLPHLNLWLDPSKSRKGPERIFVSHAHSDHIARHREVILTRTTAMLMQARLPGRRCEHHLAWRTRTEFHDDRGGWAISLHPAGHVLGSAMALIEADGESLLYTGDFKLAHGLSAELCEPIHADTLVMETTFGLPRYCFPPVPEIHSQIVRFCGESLEQGEVPVLLGYSLGKSQEASRVLEKAGLPAVVHPTVARISRIYQAAGHPLPPIIEATPETVQNHVLICPPGARLASVLPPGARTRAAVLTGWAIDRGCAYRYGAQAAIPLSDHAGFDELVAFVTQVAPRRVLTVHGFASEFADYLRELGYDARALSEPEQLTLDLGRTRILPRDRAGTAPTH